jgi:hypothetical protein
MRERDRSVSGADTGEVGDSSPSVHEAGRAGTDC